MDYNSYEEITEQMCPRCGNICSIDQRFCNECGLELKGGKAAKKSDDDGTGKRVAAAAAIIAALTIVVFGAVFFSDMVSQKSGTNEVSDEISEFMENHSDSSSEADESDEPVSFYRKGTYKIGEDIPEGEYLLLVADEVFSEREFTNVGRYEIKFEDDNDNYVEADWFENSKYVKLEGDKYVEFIWCDAYPVGTSPRENDPFKNSGMFKVGVDVPPGTYTISAIYGGDAAFWRILDDLDEQRYSELRDIGNYLSEGSVTFELSEGQYLELSHCMLKED